MRIPYCFIVLMLLCAACSADAPQDPNIPKTLQATDGNSGVLSVQVPGAWVGIGTSAATVNIANTGFAMRNYESGIEKLADEQVGGTASAVLKSALPETLNRDDIVAVAQYVAARIASPNSDMTYTFGSVSVEDNTAFTDGLGIGEGAVLDVRVLVMDAGDAYGVLFFAAPIGQLEQHFDTLTTIARTFSFINAQDFLATEARQ